VGHLLGSLGAATLWAGARAIQKLNSDETQNRILNQTHTILWYFERGSQLQAICGLGQLQT
jgi:hypothetical protein